MRRRSLSARQKIAMPIAIFGAAIPLAGWTDAPRVYLQPYAHMPSTHQPLPLPQPVRPTVPSGPALGSPIERCQIQQRGGHHE